MTTNCRKCGRQLTDPISIKLGIGPICREKSPLLKGARLVTGAVRCGSHCPQGDGIRDLTRPNDYDEIARLGLERLPETDFVMVDIYPQDATHLLFMYARNIGLVGIWNPAGETAELAFDQNWRDQRARLTSSTESIEEWWRLFNNTGSANIKWVHKDPDWARVFSFYSGPYYGRGEEPWFTEMILKDDPYACAWTARAYCFHGCGGAALELMEGMDVYDEETEDYIWEEGVFERHPPGGTNIFGLFWPIWNNMHWDLVIHGAKRITTTQAPKDEEDYFLYAADRGYFSFEEGRYAYSDWPKKPEENLLWPFTTALVEVNPDKPHDYTNEACYCGYYEGHPEKTDCECIPGIEDLLTTASELIAEL